MAHTTLLEISCRCSYVTWKAQTGLHIWEVVDFLAGPHSAVGNVSDCRSRGREFDPCRVSYFSGD